MLGLVAALAVVATLGGPGITIDEPLDVRPGRTYVETLSRRGLGFFDRATVAQVFADNAEHPPLGRWLLGIASIVGQPLQIALHGTDPLGLYVWAGRLAPALAFALLVALISSEGSRRMGRAAGFAAGLGLLLMPRVFAHAHLGALDTFITLFWVAALLAADRALASPRPLAAMTLAGLILGLALLTKIHAWLLLPLVGVWAVIQQGPRRGTAAFLAWGGVGFAIFFLGWPWLWYETGPRLLRYLGTGVTRATIRVAYLGQVYDDRAVPWHYPWVYFATTVPVGLHLLGILGLGDGLRRCRVDRFPLLLVAAIGGLLLLFSSRVPVYDGERLFLMVFPLWALLVGRGWAWIWDRLKGRRIGQGAACLLLAGQAWGIVALHPFQLSYYNALVGGLRGAERLGLELTYWGDAVDRRLLDTLITVVPDGGQVALVPTLYPGQGLASTTRAMAARKLLLGDQETVPQAGWLVVSRRTAYWPEGLAERLARGRRVATRERDGVWLAAIYQVPLGSETAPVARSP
ncbi:MAG: glycosyltransferase family 39 protein [Isosphaeraceae bacterium]